MLQSKVSWCGSGSIVFVRGISRGVCTSTLVGFQF